MTHERLSREKSSARPMDGSATLTMLASRTTTNCAAASRASANQRRSWEVLKTLLLGRIGQEVEEEFRFPLTRYGVDVPFVKPYISMRDEPRAPPPPRRRPPQPRAGHRRRPAGVRRAGARRADGRRGARRGGRRRHRLPALPNQGGAARGAGGRRV